MSALEVPWFSLSSLRPSRFRDCFSVSIHVVRLNSLRMISGWENWFPESFSCNTDWFYVPSGNLLSRLSKERELGIITSWLETWDNLPLYFDSTSWKSPVRRTFPFIDKSSCSRTCSRLDSKNPYRASCNANLCSSVCHRCTHWGTRHEVLASPSLIMPDWASDPCYLQEELGFPKAFWPSGEWDIKLSCRSAWVYCALTSLSCMTIASGLPEAF